MKKYFNVRNILNITILLILFTVFVLRIKTGQYIPLPAVVSLIIILVGISRLISTRNRFQGSEEERKEFNKIVIRSLILAPVILAVFLFAAVWIMLKTG